MLRVESETREAGFRDGLLLAERLGRIPVEVKDPDEAVIGDGCKDCGRERRPRNIANRAAQREIHECLRSMSDSSSAVCLTG